MTKWATWIIIGLAAILLLLTWLINRRNPFTHLRHIDVYKSLQRQNLVAFEQGKRFIFAIGGQFSAQDMSIGGIIGLPVLSKLSRQTVYGDQAALALSGDGSLACLSQLVLAGVYKDALVPELFSMDHTQFTGTTGMAYLGGVLPEIHKGINGGLVMIGHLRPEMALAVDLAGRHETYCVAASDSPGSQAVFFASLPQAVIGEEYYAAGANFETHPIEAASLHVQDILRILIILALIVGALSKVMGLF